MANLVFTALLTFSLLFSLSSPLPIETVTNAAETLSNSGYIGMSLTLNILSKSVLSQTKSATVFAPPDTTFAHFGQPPLPLLHSHVSPLAFTVESLRTLPYGTKIPTVSAGKFLTITTTSTFPSLDRQISLNNVKISDSPIFDDGVLIVFSIEKFLDPDFSVNAPVQSPSGSHASCAAPESNSFNNAHSFHDATGLLVSRGHSVMASFLNMQLLGFLGHPKLTVFAPVDEVMVDYSGRFPDYPSLLLRHVLPCKISWTDLDSVTDALVLSTFLDGFTVNITSSGDTVMVNEVPITFPDMYYSDWLVIHGVREILELPKPEEEDDDGEGEDQSEFSDEILTNETIARNFSTIIPNNETITGNFSTIIPINETISGDSSNIIPSNESIAPDRSEF